MKRLFKTAIALCLALIMTCSCFSVGFTGYAAQPAATNNDADFVYPVAITSAKMVRPLYIGLDSTAQTDATYGEWNYFDTYFISKYLDITVKFSNGDVKRFESGSNLFQFYSRYGNALFLSS